MDQEAQQCIDDYFGGDAQDRWDTDVIQRSIIRLENIQNEHQKCIAEKLIEMTQYLVGLRIVSRMDEMSRRMHLLSTMPADRVSLLNAIVATSKNQFASSDI